MPIACNAMFVMKSIASVWLSFDFVNRNLEGRKKFGRDYNKRATFRRGWVQLWESFLLRKQRDSREPQRMEGRSSVGKIVIIDDGAMLRKGGWSRNPYLWWHNTWTALQSYVTYTWWYNRISNWYMYIQVLIDNWICSIKGWMSDLFRRVSHSGNSQQAKSLQVNGHTNIFPSIFISFSLWCQVNGFYSCKISNLIFVRTGGPRNFSESNAEFM